MVTIQKRKKITEILAFDYDNLLRDQRPNIIFDEVSRCLQGPRDGRVRPVRALAEERNPGHHHLPPLPLLHSGHRATLPRQPLGNSLSLTTELTQDVNFFLQDDNFHSKL